MRGESVTVITRTAAGTDPFGAPLETGEMHTLVDNVLVAPGPAADSGGTTRPHGVKVRYTLYFPKALTADLRGAEVSVRGERLRVVGDPDRWPDGITPTRGTSRSRWLMSVASVDVRMNSRGARELLRSAEVESDIRGRLEAIQVVANSVGSGVYGLQTEIGPGRARGVVHTTDAVSIASNAKHNTLLKSLDAGRSRP